MHRADHDDVAEVVGDERHAPEDERAHENAAQLRIGLDQREQFVAVELDDLARLADPHPRQRAPAGEHVAFAGELTWAVGDDQRFSGGRWPQHLNPAAQHQKERDRAIAGIDEHVAQRDRAAAAVRRDAVDLRRRQGWKQSLRPLRLSRTQNFLRIRSAHVSPSSTFKNYGLSSAYPREPLYRGISHFPSTRLTRELAQGRPFESADTRGCSVNRTGR